MNELQVFRNNEFGEVRTLLVEGKPYFVARDVAISLGYKNISDAISRHCRRVVKHDIPHPQSKTKTIGMNCIPEGRAYSIDFTGKDGAVVYRGNTEREIIESKLMLFDLLLQKLEIDEEDLWELYEK